MKLYGVLLIHVDDSFFTGTPELMNFFVKEIGKEYKIGSEDWNDIMFCGQLNGYTTTKVKRITSMWIRKEE